MHRLSALLVYSSNELQNICLLLETQNLVQTISILDYYVNCATTKKLNKIKIKTNKTNHQTWELISAQKASHKHNHKDPSCLQ